MNFLIFLDDLAVAGAAVSLFTALWVISNPREGKTSDRLLGLLLVFFTLNILHPHITQMTGVGSSPVFEPLQYFLPLGLLWYLRSLSLRRWWGLEILVFILPLTFTFLSLSSPPPYFSVLFWVCLLLSSILLFIPLTLQLHRHQNQLKMQYSNLRGVDARWLSGLLRLLWLIFGLYALYLGMVLHAPLDFPFRPLLSALMGTLSFYLSWKALNRQTRRREDSEDKLMEDIPTSEVLLLRAARLKELIRVKKLYKNSELTLDGLATHSGLSRHEASIALNQGLGSTFYDLINGLRVEEFQRLCQEKSWEGEKILTLAYEAGFNSKPTFNLVFKKVTGLTPSEYRQKQSIVSHPNA